LNPLNLKADSYQHKFVSVFTKDFKYNVFIRKVNKILMYDERVLKKLTSAVFFNNFLAFFPDFNNMNKNSDYF